MRLSFQSKLLAVVATAALALLTLVVASEVISGRVESSMEDIRRRYLPKVGLGPRLEAQFERMQRGYQDAVAAADREKLAATVDIKQEFLRELAESSEAVEPALSAALAQAVEDFHAAAQAVSRRLLAGETGEAVVAQMSEMQAKQARAAELLHQATSFDRTQLIDAFNAAAAGQRTGSHVRLGVSLACLVLLVFLSLWISRNVLRSVHDLTAGFRRFGEGDFSAVIPIVSLDELGDVARQANQMAESLRDLEEERRRIDWLKGGQSGLSEQLRGELEPAQVAERAISFLARYLDCPVGALYWAVDGASLRLIGQHALGGGELAAAFNSGEGLVGQAALRPEITVVAAPAGQLRLRSGVAEGSPRAIGLVPLLRAGKITGILELASLEPWKDRSSELLLSVRENLAIALEVAYGRADLRALLTETQRQASELEESRGRLEQQADELKRASAYKSRFLANMSHELRTPLNAIIGFAELLHDEEVGPLEPQQKDFLGDVLRSGKHLLQLINDVLDLSKVEAGKLDLRPEKIDPAQLVGEVLAILRTTAATRRVEVRSQVDPALGELLLDPGRLKQVLYNYVSNALKFTPEGGTVSIRLLPEGEQSFRIEVEDTGSGISPENLRRLFVEFQHVHDSRDKKGGTGLGLALTKRLVEAQGGTVGVRSTVGQGSTFWAVLPRRVALSAPAPEAQPAIANPGAALVLIVEDDVGDQKHLAGILSKGGYAVEIASTGAAAVDLCRQKSFDAIILDILLPDMSGLDVLNQIGDGNNRGVPIIAVTVVAERGAVAGFAVQDVLPKPANAQSLLAALSRAGVAPHDPGTVLLVDDDPGSLKLVATTLNQLGYVVRCEHDGAAGLRAIHEVLPSAIILDLIMPGMNGFEFLERLRREPIARRVPVIVWTVKDLTAEERAFLRASAQAVVSKGQGSGDVLAELKTVLKPKKAA